MQFHILRPILYTNQLEDTIAFYTGVLGFTIEDKSDDWRWASLLLDKVGIMLSAPNEHTNFDKAGFTGSFYITTDDVNGIWEKVKGKARICYQPETFEWGMREFGIYDNNGYLIQFGQEVR